MLFDKKYRRSPDFLSPITLGKGATPPLHPQEQAGGLANLNR